MDIQPWDTAPDMEQPARVPDLVLSVKLRGRGLKRALVGQQLVQEVPFGKRVGVGGRGSLRAGRSGGSGCHRSGRHTGGPLSDQ